MAFIDDEELIRTFRPDRIIVHEANTKEKVFVGFNEIVTPILRPDLVRSESVDISQIKGIHEL